MSANNTASPAVPMPEELQVFQKRLIVHVIVMNDYTVLQTKAGRIEFHGPLQTPDIETIVASLRTSLTEQFKTTTGS